MEKKIPMQFVTRPRRRSHSSCSVPGPIVSEYLIYEHEIFAFCIFFCIFGLLWNSFIFSCRRSRVELVVNITVIVVLVLVFLVLEPLLFSLVLDYIQA